MLGYISGPPGNAAVLFSGSVQCAVPSVEHIGSKIFGTLKIAGLSSGTPCIDQFTDNPTAAVPGEDARCTPYGDHVAVPVYDVSSNVPL